MNKVILLGKLTRDPEVRHTPNNSAVGQFSVAINRKWRDKSGQMQEEVTFVDCEAWGKTAENIAKFFSKGKTIIIEGRLKLDQWEDKNGGGRRSKLKVVVELFYFADDRREDSVSEPKARTAVRSDDTNGGGDDEIPF